MRTIAQSALSVFVAAIAIGACSSTSATPKTTASSTTTTTSGAANPKTIGAFLAAVTPASAIPNTFATQYQQWNSTTTGAQAEAEARPTVAVYKYLETVLQKQKWPSVATAGVHALIEATGTVLAELDSLPTVIPSGGSGWIAKYQADRAQLELAENRVSHDLGVPSGQGS